MSQWVSRSAWGARAPSGSGNTLSSSPKGHAIHWEGPKMGVPAHSSCDDTVRGIQNYHMDSNGWSDIAYNILVASDVAARGLDVASTTLEPHRPYRCETLTAGRLKLRTALPFALMGATARLCKGTAPPATRGTGLCHGPHQGCKHGTRACAKPHAGPQGRHQGFHQELKIVKPKPQVTGAPYQTDPTQGL